ncbi:MAG TPA: MoaD/ThiS family protein [Humidesulfovibrio sp.]|uniref:MoaD/ThiS family protein n=1 Tax=Humidesulfovibrio sp. TaxID=2910988 RepID=UPI002CAE9808|nr:MoaD/ThiS family protein [Humidesulfovibrio sp.]HWR04733.1 MoaD/ThiS family protein [Humidesulfovibrio sp.]
MNITLKCFASLSRFSPPDAEAYPVTPGETVASVVARLGIPVEELKLVFVNGTHAELSAPLADGDRLGLFPAVGGG